MNSFFPFSDWNLPWPFSIISFDSLNDSATTRSNLLTWISEVIWITLIFILSRIICTIFNVFQGPPATNWIAKVKTRNLTHRPGGTVSKLVGLGIEFSLLLGLSAKYVEKVCEKFFTQILVWTNSLYIHWLS